MQSILDKACKYLFVISLLACIYLYLHKDELPVASFYNLEQLGDPRQYPTGQEAFKTAVNGEKYLITPRYNYELEGVIVSYHITDFEVVRKANQALRSFYPIAFWTTIISLTGMVVMFVVMPFKGRYAQDV